MILEFKTKRNANGHHKYLAIDTGVETYSTECSRMIIEGIEITATAMKELREMAERNNYKRVDYVC